MAVNSADGPASQTTSSVDHYLPRPEGRLADSLSKRPFTTRRELIGALDHWVPKACSRKAKQRSWWTPSDPSGRPQRLRSAAHAQDPEGGKAVRFGEPAGLKPPS